MVGQKFSQRTPFAVVPPWFVLVKTLATNLAFDGVGRVGVGTDVAFVLGLGFVSGTFRAVVTLMRGGGCWKKEEGTRKGAFSGRIMFNENRCLVYGK